MLIWTEVLQTFWVKVPVITHMEGGPVMTQMGKKGDLWSEGRNIVSPKGSMPGFRRQSQVY